MGKELPSKVNFLRRQPYPDKNPKFETFNFLTVFSLPFRFCLKSFGVQFVLSTLWLLMKAQNHYATSVPRKQPVSFEECHIFQKPHWGQFDICFPKFFKEFSTWILQDHKILFGYLDNVLTWCLWTLLKSVPVCGWCTVLICHHNIVITELIKHLNIIHISRLGKARSQCFITINYL